EERITHLERSLATAGIQLAEAVPLVAPLLDLPLPDGYPPPPAADVQRKKLLAALTARLFGLGRLQPPVVVVEDLPSADPSTLELQGLLVERADTAPVLILYTARPEFRVPWPLLAHHAQVTLGRLARHHVRAMVARVAAQTVRIDELIETVVTRTDGVPRFAEELTKAVLEAEGNGTTTSRTIPATLQDSLMARLDRLGPSKEVAQVASVIGREFSYALLRAVSPLPEEELRAALDRLAETELVYRRGLPPGATYVFQHALVPQAPPWAPLRGPPPAPPPGPP